MGLAKQEAEIRSHHAELVGVYYGDGFGTPLSPQEVSAQMDAYGWDAGWRISDDEWVLWTSGLFAATPSVFIVETSTMEVVAAEQGTSPQQIDVLAVVAGIDAEG